MKKMLFVLVALCTLSCNSNSQKGFTVKTEVPKHLKEISGIISVGNDIWAISDKPRPVFFKLSDEGKLLQEITLKNMTVTDVEAITADDRFLYIGDVGDNEGNRKDRRVIKVLRSGIGAGMAAETSGEFINFTFPDEVLTTKKKQNDYDCESVMSFNDSLYLFTKRRTDDECQLFVVPKAPGTYTARYISTYDTKGLITDAAVNSSKNEVALTGYRKGHTDAFLLFFKNFQGNNFFSGSPQRVELSDKKTEWQVEGVTYKTDNTVYISCEQTKDVAASIFAAQRNNLVTAKKKKMKQ